MVLIAMSQHDSIQAVDSPFFEQRDDRLGSYFKRLPAITPGISRFTKRYGSSSIDQDMCASRRRDQGAVALPNIDELNEP
ncbi:hypothetical protein D3C76_1518050 [compost metagenome]